LYTGGTLVTQFSAGQFPHTRGSLRGRPAAAIAVARKMSTLLDEVLQGVPPVVYEPPRPPKAKPWWWHFDIPHRPPPRITRRRFRVQQGMTHLTFKLKNYLPHKAAWWRYFFSQVFSRVTAKVTLRVLIQPVMPHPHNGLRPRKPIRQ